MGSDAVFTGFGENTRDLGWFVKAGMTPTQALDSATNVGVRFSINPRSLDSLAQGRSPIWWRSTAIPFKDIAAVLKVKWVMKGARS
jgi:hypothetical protein